MHSAEVIWTCDGDFASGQYSRAHHWRFDGGIEVAAAPSPSIQVASYRDTATGALRRADGVVWIPRVDLNIVVVFSGETPDEAAHMALHDKAHHACFIANSVKTEIVVNLS